MKMQIPGEDAPGVMECISLLREVSLGKKVNLGKRVAVIGGGNAAIDASRTALRMGAQDVTILYRRSREEMPANEEEVGEALREGVKIDYLVSPAGIVRDNGHLRLECFPMQLGKTDAEWPEKTGADKGQEEDFQRFR